MGLLLSRYEDAKQFLADCGDFLYSRASVNNLMLGVCERLARNPTAHENPFFAALFNESGIVLLAAVMTPPHNIILAGGEAYPDALAELVAYLKKESISPPGVIGPVEMAEAFARLWGQETGAHGKVGMYQRVYELRRVRQPQMTPGQFRAAQLEDRHKIAQWYKAFVEEALDEAQALDLELAEKIIKNGNAFVWEREGELVSMALKTRPLTHSVTVSGVYTPPECRRQGYATALVARLSQHLLDSGYDFINLFTDLENPTSNAIYQKIGFHPVCDFRMYKFEQADRD